MFTNHSLTIPSKKLSSNFTPFSILPHLLGRLHLTSFAQRIEPDVSVEMAAISTSSFLSDACCFSG